MVLLALEGLIRWAVELTVISDFRTREGIATEIRDNLETLAPPVFRPFLEKLFPVFRDTLRGEPVFDSFSWEHVRSLVGGAIYHGSEDICVRNANRSIGRKCAAEYWKSYIVCPSSILKSSLMRQRWSI